MAIITYNDNGTIKVVKYGNYVVSTDANSVPITATFNSNSGSPTYTSQSGYGSLYVTSPGTPTRSGYGFKGWSPVLPRTITKDTTFVAQWGALTWQPTGSYTWDDGYETVSEGGSCSTEGSYGRRSISDSDRGYQLFQCKPE